MHIKSFDFPKASEVIKYDANWNGHIILGAEIIDKEFWCQGTILLLVDKDKENSVYVMGSLFCGNTVLLSTEKIYCEDDKKSITTAYNKAAVALKTLYTEWVYKNIFGQNITPDGAN